MARTQAFREVAVGTPLGEDVLLLMSFSGMEQLSRPFEYELELLSENHAVTFDDIVGQNVTVRLALSNGETRYFNGYVSRFVQAGSVGRLTRYCATIVPWLWFLTRMADCRIFQEMTVPDIIKQVFGDRGFDDFEDRLSGTYRQWEYCVQYRETDFNFVNRLMEQEGIYYYFKHEDGKHTLVLADAASSHDPFPDYEEIPLRPPEQALREGEHIWAWTIEHRVQPGAYALNDYDFKAPKKALWTKAEVVRKHAMATAVVYDYPGEYVEFADGEAYARTRIEELQAQHEVLEGQSDARGICPGCKFSLTNHPRQDQCREYLITSATYQLESNQFDSAGQASGGGPVYSCSFTAIDSKEPFRPPRVTPKPVVQGPQTAIVTGPKGEEIFPDEYGRVKVHFHWDRYGKVDEKSSCWIRVSQVWAGKGWGAMSIPRIGQEVIVEFLEGDPDRPIITGRVYNGQSMPPYGLPGKKVVSGMKSNSTPGGGGYNEMSMDDTQGTEKITIHGQYDMSTTIENDQTDIIHNNRTTTVDVDDTETIGSNQTVTVGADQSITVGGNQSLSVGSNQDQVIGANRSITVGGDETTTVSGSRTLTVGASESISVGASRSLVVGAAHSIAVGANLDVSAAANTSMASGANTNISAGASIKITAGSSVTISAAGSSITIGASGITLSTGGIITEQASLIKHNT